jgi:hypothetical protein
MPIIIANLVWPALYVVDRMTAIVPIVAGLAVEFVFLRYATSLRGFRCFSADLAMNFASALLGIVLIPLVGIAWEFVAAITIHPLFGVGTFNPATWIATALLAAVANAAIEGQVLKSFFGLPMNRRFFVQLTAVNLVTVLLAFLSLHRDPPKF